MFSEEHLYAIALRKCNKIGDINFQKLVKTVGSAKEVWGTRPKELSKILGIGSKTISEIGSLEHLHFAEKELLFCDKNQIQIKLRYLGDFPKLLNECDDAPAILYQKGKFNENLPAISIVGTRSMTNYGKKFVEDFFKEISSKKVISVSGLALGADTAVHECSLTNNIPTIGVLAHGFHTLYPSKNKKLAEKIVEHNGALISEFNSSQKPDRENFIQRNRIIAGFSESIIVVETAFGGGSVSTVGFANTYNREVYALPGKITDKYSQGCNQLIAQNKARTISSISEMIDELGLNKEKTKIGTLFPRSEIRLQLADNQKIILDLIFENSGISLDEISNQTNIPSHKLLPILLELELLGYIKSLSGRQYIAI